MASRKPELRYRQAKLSLMAASGFVAVGLLLLVLVAAAAVIAWIVIVVACFTILGELITIAKLRKEM